MRRFFGTYADFLRAIEYRIVKEPPRQAWYAYPETSIDLHRRQSVIIRKDADGQLLSKVHIDNDALALASAVADAGPNPKVVVEATFGWYWADPAASIAIGLLVIYSAWDLVRQAIAILMESTPPHLSLEAVEEAILSVPGVCEVHDLHVWTITSGMESLSAHVVLHAGHEHQASLESVRQVLHERFGIDHITIQIDPAGQEECRSSF